MQAGETSLAMHYQLEEKMIFLIDRLYEAHRGFYYRQLSPADRS